MTLDDIIEALAEIEDDAERQRLWTGLGEAVAAASRHIAAVNHRRASQMVIDWPVLDRAAFTAKYPGWVNDETFHVAYARSQEWVDV